MTPATLTSRTLEIDGMTGDTCVNKVKAALKSVPSVTTQSVTVGEATITADDAGCQAACAAIDRAGYKSHAEDHEGDEDAVDDDSSRNPLKTSFAKGDVTQPRASNPNNGARDDRGSNSIPFKSAPTKS